MSFVPKSLKDFGFEHRFTISLLYLEKDNNVSFAGIYNKKQKDYFCIMAYGHEFIYFPFNNIDIERLIKNQINFFQLILKSSKQIQFSSDNYIARFFILGYLFFKCGLRQYKTLPNTYYEWYAYLRNNKTFNQ